MKKPQLAVHSANYETAFNEFGIARFQTPLHGSSDDLLGSYSSREAARPPYKIFFDLGIPDQNVSREACPVSIIGQTIKNMRQTM